MLYLGPFWIAQVTAVLLAVQTSMLDALYVYSRFLHASILPSYTLFRHPLRAALRSEPDSDNVTLQLSTLLKVLELEAYHLRQWHVDVNPAFFTQQLYIRATQLGIEWLSRAAYKRLESLGVPYLEVLWSGTRQSSELTRTLVGHSEPVKAIALNHNGTLLISGSDDKTVKVWDLTVGTIVHTFLGHSEEVTAVALTTDTRFAVSSDAAGYIKVWDLLKLEEKLTIRAHGKTVQALGLALNNQHFVSGGRDGIVKLWNLETGGMVAQIERFSRLMEVVCTHDGRRALIASEGPIRMWDLTTKELSTFKEDGSGIVALALASDDQFAVSASRGGLCEVWDLHSGKAISSFPSFPVQPQGQVTAPCVAFPTTS